ncbi:MAG TPA: glycosyltransferase family 2 protein [Ferruginibacter sp.]|nr:glycosyltransferase family 2 protein [Ferruginibacter sp.]
MKALSVVVITYNEEKNIRRCIASVQQVADEIIILDSFSDDATVQIAAEMGAIVKQSVFNGYISQKNKAIAMASNEYVLLLDADEMLGEELAHSILEAKKNGFTCKAYNMKRCNVFLGKYIRHGLWYPDKKLRLFDKRIAICGGYDPHDKIIMQQEVVVKLLKGDLVHHTFDNMNEYLKRNEEVSTVAARSLYNAGIRRSRLKIVFSPLWSFINGYFLRLGFLEGSKGFVIAAYTAQQSYLKYQKLRQLYRREMGETGISLTSALTNKL